MLDEEHPPPSDSNVVHHLVSTIQNIASMFDFPYEIPQILRMGLFYQKKNDCTNVCAN